MTVSNIQKDAGRSWTYTLDTAFIGVSARQVVSSFRSARPRTLPWLTLGFSTLLLARHLWEDRKKASQFSVSAATKDLWEGARFVTETLFGPYFNIEKFQWNNSKETLIANGKTYDRSDVLQSIVGHCSFIALTGASILLTRGRVPFKQALPVGAFFALNTLYTQNLIQKNSGEDFWKKDWRFVNVFTMLNFVFYFAGIRTARVMAAERGTAIFQPQTLREIMEFSARVSVLGSASYPLAYWAMDANLLNAMAVDVPRTWLVTTLLVTPFRTCLGYTSLHGSVASEVIQQNILRGAFTCIPLFAGTGVFVDRWKDQLRGTTPNNYNRMTQFYWACNSSCRFMTGETRLEEQDFWTISNEVPNLSVVERSAFLGHVEYLRKKVRGNQATEEEKRLYAMLNNALGQNIPRDPHLVFMDQWGPRSLWRRFNSSLSGVAKAGNSLPDRVPSSVQPS